MSSDPVKLEYRVEIPRFSRRDWWVVISPFLLSCLSVYIVFKNASDEPYFGGIYLRDFLEQVVLGAMVIIAWLIYDALALFTFRGRLILMFVVPAVLWSTICILYGMFAFFDYLHDVGLLNHSPSLGTV